MASHHKGEVVEVCKDAGTGGFHNIIGKNYGVRQENFVVVPEPFQPESGMVFQFNDKRKGIFVQKGEILVLLIEGTNLDSHLEYFGTFSNEDTLEDYTHGTKKFYITKVVQVNEHHCNLLIPKNLTTALTHGKVMWEREPQSVEIVLAENMAVVRKDTVCFEGAGDISISELETIIATAKTLG